MKRKIQFGCALLLLLPMGYVMSYTMSGGNLTEELSLLHPHLHLRRLLPALPRSGFPASYRPYFL